MLKLVIVCFVGLLFGGCEGGTSSGVDGGAVYVIDKQGNFLVPLPGLKVYIWGSSDSTEIAVDNLGHFHFPEEDPGYYFVSADLAGFTYAFSRVQYGGNGLPIDSANIWIYEIATTTPTLDSVIKHDSYNWYLYATLRSQSSERVAFVGRDLSIGDSFYHFIAAADSCNPVTFQWVARYPDNFKNIGSLTGKEIYAVAYNKFDPNWGRHETSGPRSNVIVP